MYVDHRERLLCTDRQQKQTPYTTLLLKIIIQTTRGQLSNVIGGYKEEEGQHCIRGGTLKCFNVCFTVGPRNEDARLIWALGCAQNNSDSTLHMVEL